MLILISDPKCPRGYKREYPDNVKEFHKEDHEDIQECGQRCMKHQDCRSFTYRPSQHECRFKKSSIPLNTKYQEATEDIIHCQKEGKN